MATRQELAEEELQSVVVVPFPPEDWSPIPPPYSSEPLSPPPYSSEVLNPPPYSKVVLMPNCPPYQEDLPPPYSEVEVTSSTFPAPH
ncbi:uncharacterized protein LOC136747326 [Amia ocellicauda]|uniref:uncharacterized protein LOC136747326 n=1 Tax=Amia ocellicauda TaxID=2972642 RepID=UPI0034649975